jgi:antitoxin (DNA-binding transcriptional repressor) of toxin-antitoxin stability system
MRAVGVRELKAHLSRYLREVRAGEVILVTDRNRVVAELRAPEAPEVEESEVARGLRRLAAEGRLRVGETHRRDAYRSSPLHAPAGTARRLLDKERAEG